MSTKQMKQKGASFYAFEREQEGKLFDRLLAAAETITAANAKEELQAFYDGFREAAIEDGSTEGSAKSKASQRKRIVQALFEADAGTREVVAEYAYDELMSWARGNDPFAKKTAGGKSSRRTAKQFHKDLEKLVRKYDGVKGIKDEIKALMAEL